MASDAIATVLMASSKPPTNSAISLFTDPLPSINSAVYAAQSRLTSKPQQQSTATKTGRRRRRAPRDGLEQLGERIRTLRIERGLSQAQLGSPYFTRAHVSAIELGKILPALTTLVHLSRKLGVHARDLLP
jgi:ribosome-binding protein aMBF1 (putative translation factor)